MQAKARIVNAEPEGSQSRLSVEVVTVGVNSANEGVKHVLAAGQSVVVDVNQGQFVMVDATEKGPTQ